MACTKTVTARVLEVRLCRKPEHRVSLNKIPALMFINAALAEICKAFYSTAIKQS